MNLSHFFIDRPIFAMVLSIFITLLGGFAYLSLPVAQYPEIAPPTIVISATYPGASAQVVSETVATPLEEEINGVEHMLYMTSQSTGDGNCSSPSPSRSAPISISRRCWCRTGCRSRSRGCRRTCSASASRCARTRPT